ncbi:MAG: xanthine dehydrogenase family protein subunit, partial [Pseudonocardia sp.]|nr:xanthine dehydrogenase family protein subunit [Pseudonocardia sp.]
MKPPPFRYAIPTTVAEAVGLLVEHADAEPRVL